MKRTVLILSLAAGLVSMSPLAHASLDDFLRSVNIQAMADKDHYYVKLSAQFGIPESDVRVIVSSVSSPADAFMVLQLGQMAHQEPAVVLRQYKRRHGKGWGRLAQDLGIKPGSREFHALKRGDLSFTGERGGDRRGDGREESMGNGRGNGHGKGRGNGRGNGRGDD